ncbi:MAG: low temperature requirement protein A, partial [Longimicrobiales bacterium]
MAVLLTSFLAGKNRQLRSDHPLAGKSGLPALLRSSWPEASCLPVVFGTVLAVIEFAGPVLAERTFGGRPWHAQHIAERYGFFAIIALGEGIVGTVAALSAIIAGEGWTLDTILVGIAGTGLTFGMWWIYELVPSAQILAQHCHRAFVWSFCQIVVIAAIVATGAGLHVSAGFLEQQTHIGALATLLTVALPYGAFLIALEFLYYYLTRRMGAFDV